VSESVPVNDDQRQGFINEWAKMLKCEPNAFHIAAGLINKYKNWQSACYLIFGLSVHNHRDWIVACAKHMEENCGWVDKETPMTVEYLIEFQNYYVTEVAKYPEGA
jgi:hypothetical protein